MRVVLRSLRARRHLQEVFQGREGIASRIHRGIWSSDSGLAVAERRCCAFQLIYIQAKFLEEFNRSLVHHSWYPEDGRRTAIVPEAPARNNRANV
jgi:hypothetical protein